MGKHIFFIVAISLQAGSSYEKGRKGLSSTILMCLACDDHILMLAICGGSSILLSP